MTTMTHHEFLLEQRFDQFVKLVKSQLSDLEDAQQTGRLDFLDTGLEFMARAFFSEEQLWTLERQSSLSSWQNELSMRTWFALEEDE